MEDVIIFKNAKRCCTNDVLQYLSGLKASCDGIKYNIEYCVVSFGDSFTIFMHLYFAKENKAITTIKKYFFS